MKKVISVAMLTTLLPLQVFASCSKSGMEGTWYTGENSTHTTTIESECVASDWGPSITQYKVSSSIHGTAKTVQFNSGVITAIFSNATQIIQSRGGIKLDITTKETAGKSPSH
ncbi:hypothetical protein [Vibrio coralliilyticus]|uniref:hypothetical protein n=1 Tax=Vibrio coralliilyticus TaxID=190893 RepID=UPI0015602BE7|nr:hypothetical protein [Vibrio coralliilyticus]NRF12894.1 hypothetical protein [Vibrio coralliilyticus]